MDELVAFVRKRLDEDERVALAASDPGTGNWNGNLGFGPMVEDTAGNVVVYDEGYPTDEQAFHIARWDPARVLAEVEAKRRILDGLFDDWGMCRDDIASGTAKPVLALLAQPYAGRDGWREEWRI